MLNDNNHLVDNEADQNASSLFARVLAAFFLLFSGFYLYHAYTSYTFGSLASPRAGFMPTVVGILAIIISSINFLKSMSAEDARPHIQTRPLLVILLVAGLVGYVLLLRITGFLPAAAIALFYLLKVSGTRGWLVPLALAVAVSGVLYVAFALLLNVRLP